MTEGVARTVNPSASFCAVVTVAVPSTRFASSRALFFRFVRAVFLVATALLVRIAGSHAASADAYAVCSAVYAVASGAVSPYAVGVAVISVLKFNDHARSAASEEGRKVRAMDANSCHRARQEQHPARHALNRPGRRRPTLAAPTPPGHGKLNRQSREQLEMRMDKSRDFEISKSRDKKISNYRIACRHVSAHYSPTRGNCARVQINFRFLNSYAALRRNRIKRGINSATAERSTASMERSNDSGECSKACDDCSNAAGERLIEIADFSARRGERRARPVKRSKGLGERSTLSAEHSLVIAACA